MIDSHKAKHFVRDCDFSQSEKVVGQIGQRSDTTPPKAFLVDDNGDYIATRPITRVEILEHAAQIRADAVHGMDMTGAQRSAEWATSQIGHLEHEKFIAIWLDVRNRVIGWEVLFRGTIDGTAVYTREVVKAALAANAANVIVAHNHPSGDPKPSKADKDITKQLTEALGLIDVPLVDHLVVSSDRYVSFAEENLL